MTARAGLSDRDLRRYARHLTLPGVGAAGQQALRNSRVLVVGAGGLGSPILLYLAAAGIGHVTIIDHDLVDESNLQRQVIHRECDLGRPKAESARDALHRLDSEMSVEVVVDKLGPGNALELFRDHDIVLDGADNFATRYLASDTAEITGTPLVWGTILQFEGQISVFWPGRGPMLRDLYPDMPDPDSVPSCAAGGVLGAMVGQVGSMMAVEAVKVLAGIGEVLTGRLLLIDALTATTRTLTFDVDPERERVTDLGEYAAICGDGWAEGGASGAGAAPAAAAAPAAVAAPASVFRSVGPNEAFALASGDVPAMIVDVRNPEERAAVHIPSSVFVPMYKIEQSGWHALRAALSDAGMAGEATVVMHCHAGSRSARAIELLAKNAPAPAGSAPDGSALAPPTEPTETNVPDGVVVAGGLELVNLEGGIVAWQAACLPTATSSPTPTPEP